jgi:hypothetical protein
MINFELQYERPKHIGLKMELSSSPSAASPASSVWVGEDAFGFLEPSVKKHCAEYREFSHWGVTEIKRGEWLAIKEDWQRLAVKLGQTDNAREYDETVWLQSDDSRRELTENFEAIRSGVPRLIQELSHWIDDTLASRQSIFLKGI